MQLKYIGEQLETYIPSRYAASWDNVGWMLGPLSQELTGTLVCVDVSREALDRALDQNLNLILSHHPLIFDPVSRLIESNPQHRLILDAARNNVGIYSVHTNADSMPGGLNDWFADVFDLQDTTPLEPQEDDPEAGLGRIGTLPDPCSLQELEQTLADHFELSHMQSLGDPSRPLGRVAVCTGSGGDFVGAELAEQADVYITGDVGHHKAMEARSLDLPLIILDHYEMETVFLPFAESIWKEQFGSQYPLEIFRRENPYRHRFESRSGPKEASP